MAFNTLCAQHSQAQLDDSVGMRQAMQAGHVPGPLLHTRHGRGAGQRTRLQSSEFLRDYGEDLIPLTVRAANSATKQQLQDSSIDTAESH